MVHNTHITLIIPNIWPVALFPRELIGDKMDNSPSRAASASSAYDNFQLSLSIYSSLNASFLLYNSRSSELSEYVVAK